MSIYHTLIHACGASHLGLIYVYAFNLLIITYVVRETL